MAQVVRPSERKFVVLEKTQELSSPAAKSWLEARGFAVSEADSVFEAMEYFADFTLRNCPDCIVVNVDSIPVDLNSTAMWSATMSADDVAILCLDADGPEKPLVARDLGQLSSLMRTECGRSYATV